MRKETKKNSVYIADSDDFTLRLECVAESFDRELNAIIIQHELQRKIDALVYARPSSRPSRLAEIYRCFDAIDVKYETGQNSDYYSRLLNESFNSQTTSSETIEQRVIEFLLYKYKNYPSPRDYLKRTVDQFENPEDGWKNDTLRLRILKQTIKYGNYLTYRDNNNHIKRLYRGESYIQSYAAEKAKAQGKTIQKSDADEVIQYLEDGVFEVLNSATRPQKRANGIFGILNFVNEISAGHFHPSGSTKKGLYLLAILYDLDWNYKKEPNERDIRKVLFADYYENNLIRFLDEEYYAHPSNYELVPSGQGINYKNFAEVVYLYYIARKDLERSERIRRASIMIQELKDRQSNFSPRRNTNVTGLYRGLFDEGVLARENILKMDDQQFFNFIFKNYNCRTTTNGQIVDSLKPIDNAQTVKISELMVEADQKSAWKEFQRFYNYVKSIADNDLDLLHIGLSFFGIRENDSPFLSNFRKNTSIPNEKEFIRLAQILDKYIRNDVLAISGPSEMSRSALLGIIYKYFILKPISEDKKIPSLAHIYHEFETLANPSLETAGYQKLNKKSFFDMTLVISAFLTAYL